MTFKPQFPPPDPNDSATSGFFEKLENPRKIMCAGFFSFNFC
jgi:hypothetical protein